MVAARVRAFGKSALYRAGGLDALKRFRNRRVLTVIMLHRVLDRHDVRWSLADHGWTLDTELFSMLIDCVGRNYNWVSWDDVRDALQGNRRLPNNSILLTFDDGWADNVEFALPLLRSKGVPALVFVAGAAINRERAFWREHLRMVVKAGKAGRIVDGIRGAPRRSEELSDESAAEAIISTLERLRETDPSRFQQAVERIEDEKLPGCPAMMVDGAGIRALKTAGLAIGVHGYSHEPLTAVRDVRKEIAESIQRLKTILGDAALLQLPLSFPHGQDSAQVIKDSKQCGIANFFSSEPVLNRVVAPIAESAVFGRINVSSQGITDGDGHFSAQRTAYHLLLRPVTTLGRVN